jgi:hypothetical protein
MESIMNLFFKLKKITFLLLFLAFAVPIFAQKVSAKINLRDKEQQHKLISSRGDQFIGRILYLDSNKVRFELNSGSIITYKLEEIEELGVVNETEEDEYDDQFYNPFSELFISKTAFNLGRRQKQFQNSQFLLNRLDLGATDNYSIGVGYVMPYTLLLKSKISTNDPNRFFNYGAGIDFMFGLSGPRTSRRLIHLYTVASIGKSNNFLNISTGLSIPLRSTNNTRVKTPFFMSIGGLFSLSEKFKVIIDTLFIDRLDQSWYPGIGISWLVDRNRFDLGLFYFSDFISDPVSAPGVGYLRSF